MTRHPPSRRPGGPRGRRRRQPRLLAACGSGDPQPADGSGSARGSDSDEQDHRLLAAGAEDPRHEGPLRGRHALRRQQGLRGHRAGPEPRPAEAGHRPAERRSSPAGPPAPGRSPSTPSSMTALVEKAQADEGPADPQRHPRGYGLDGLAARPLVLHDRLRGAGQGDRRGARQLHQREARRQGRGHLRGERPRHRRQGGARDRRQGGARRHRSRRRDRRHRRRQGPRSRRRPTSAAPCRATRTSRPSSANNDEGALGAIGAFKAAGKDLPCLTEAGGNEEVLPRSRPATSTPRSPCSSRPTWPSRSTP